MCNDCKKKTETRISAFTPYVDVCQPCEQGRADRKVVRAMDPDAWPVKWGAYPKQS